MNVVGRANDDGAFDCMAVSFDASRKTIRNEISPEYKANRDEPPEELRPQFALVREATEAFGLPAIQMQGFEADDLIATYARQAEAAGIETVVVSSDKDLMPGSYPHLTLPTPPHVEISGGRRLGSKEH